MEQETSNDAEFGPDEGQSEAPGKVVSAPTIFIIKKKRAHGGHHGGAWKVAYADFVTAMMALFIVLWLLSSNTEVRKSVAGYFRDPKGFGPERGSSMSGNGEGLKVVSKGAMSLLQDKIGQSLKSSPQFQALKEYVQMTVTGDGLRIELLETEKGVFFKSGQAVPTENGKALIEQLASMLGSMSQTLLVEGHTDSSPFGGGEYSNWELSIDRANAARNIMEKAGLRPNQVVQVRGFADQQPRLPDRPEDASNRRVSIIVQFPVPSPADEPPVKGSKENAEAAATPPISPNEGTDAPNGTKRR